jgi:UPF0755 protein
MMATRRSRPRKYFIPWGCLALPVALCVLAFSLYLLFPYWIAQTYGPPSVSLGGMQRLQYSLLMFWYDGAVTRPVDSTAGEASFTIAPGEDVASVAARLEQAGIIHSASAFRAYLIYAGLDTGIQAGEFTLSPALAPLQIAQKLQDATPAQVKFVVLPGWRLEEVAASLPTSGLNITPEEFLQATRAPRPGFDYFPSDASAEGFLLPGEYTLPRDIRADQLVQTLMRNFALDVTAQLRAGFTRQGLNVYQAVILASIIQREAVKAEEQPIIASVFLNRIAAGMKLETDPTIQYAIGYNPATNSWWKAPLALDDLAFNSAYNTYQNPGLPPGPICSPALSALQAVAYPAQTPYYFFRARCDGSGLHNFSETFDQHMQNACP